MFYSKSRADFTRIIFTTLASLIKSTNNIHRAGPYMLTDQDSFSPVTMDLGIGFRKICHITF